MLTLFALCLVGLDFDLVSTTPPRSAFLLVDAYTPPEVQFFTASWCINCPEAKDILDEYEIILRIRDVDKPGNESPSGSVPYIWAGGYCVEGNNPAAIHKLMQACGARVKSRKAKRRVIEPVVVQQPITVARYSGPLWTWPGNLRSHLMANHGYSAEQLAGLSQSELKALHDNAHNHGESGFSGGGILQFSSGSVGSSSCPIGNCPTSSGGSNRCRSGFRIFRRGGG